MVETSKIKTTMSDSGVQFFEGVEKLLEIWFTSDDNTNKDLRKIPRLDMRSYISVTGQPPQPAALFLLETSLNHCWRLLDARSSVSLETNKSTPTCSGERRWQNYIRMTGVGGLTFCFVVTVKNSNKEHVILFTCSLGIQPSVLHCSVFPLTPSNFVICSPYVTFDITVKVKVVKSTSDRKITYNFDFITCDSSEDPKTFILSRSVNFLLTVITLPSNR